VAGFFLTCTNIISIQMAMKKDIRIAFMGTPEFAAASLMAIINAGYKIVVVITSPDKPAGRGKQLSESPVKKIAVKMGLHILQPENLKAPHFVEQFQICGANLGVVVAFRMLPEVIWAMPEFGTFNLHASLLPNYRGAAPINHAIMNGEHETGVSTFFLNHEIDTGDILQSEKVCISPNETAGDIHDRLMLVGANLVLKTIQTIESETFVLQSQTALTAKSQYLKTAPKIFKNDCLIRWNQPGAIIYNQIRGLSPLPGAFTFLANEAGEKRLLKIYFARFQFSQPDAYPGKIETDGRNYLAVHTIDGKIFIEDLQLQGKKRMDVQSFLNGFDISKGLQIVEGGD